MHNAGLAATPLTGAHARQTMVITTDRAGFPLATISAVLSASFPPSLPNTWLVVSTASLAEPMVGSRIATPTRVVKTLPKCFKIHFRFLVLIFCCILSAISIKQVMFYFIMSYLKNLFFD